MDGFSAEAPRGKEPKTAWVELERFRNRWLGLVCEEVLEGRRCASGVEARIRLIGFSCRGKRLPALLGFYWFWPVRLAYKLLKEIWVGPRLKEAIKAREASEWT